jgi:hypothetical protein
MIKRNLFLVLGIVFIFLFATGFGFAQNSETKCKLVLFEKLYSGEISSLECNVGANQIVCKENLCTLTTKRNILYSWEYQINQCGGNCQTNGNVQK